MGHTVYQSSPQTGLQEEQPAVWLIRFQGQPLPPLLERIDLLGELLYKAF